MSCTFCGAGTCGGCAGVQPSTPQRINNRFGLPRLSYRSGRYPEFRASMTAGLTRQDRLRLGALRTREPDDPTVALIDAFACVCDVHTFYTERLANESYLRTSTDPVSLQELGRLLGYRPAAGAAAQTHLAFTLERLPAVPTGLGTDPGLVPPVVPTAVELPAGLRVMSVPGPGEQPVTFETVQPISARSAWNSLHAWTSPPPAATVSATGAWFAGAALPVTVGDALLFVGQPTGATAYGHPVADAYRVRFVTGVSADAAEQRTKLSWTSTALIPVGGAIAGHPAALPVELFAFILTEVLLLRTTASVFGATAPDWTSLPVPVRRQYVPGIGNLPSDWPNFAAVDAAGRLDVDGSHPNLSVGSWLLVDGTGGRNLYRIRERTEGARAGFGISGRVTRLALAGPTLSATPREVTCYGGGQPLTLVAGPDLSVTQPGATTLMVHGDLSDMPQGRPLVVAGTTDANISRCEQVTLHSSPTYDGATGTSTLTLRDGLTHRYRQASLVLYGNVALATHGVSVSQILGDGRAAAAGQTFTLNATPVTQVQGATGSGTASTLRVSVDGLAWEQVATLYGRGPSDRVFVTDRPPAGESVVVLGDGIHGARAATGSQNVRASYRQGLGSIGNVAAGKLSQPVDRPLGLKAVSNPLAATGGVDPDGPEAARTRIPVSVRTLGRVVSVSDYQDFALAFSGVAKADVTVLTLRSGETVVVTVAGVDGAALSAQKVADLQEQLLASGDPHVAVRILSYEPIRFGLTASLVIDSEPDKEQVRQAARQAWVGAFDYAYRALAQPVFRSEVITVAQRVPGVLGVDLDALYLSGGPMLANRLVAEPARVGASGEALPARLLTLDPALLEIRP